MIREPRVREAPPRAGEESEQDVFVERSVERLAEIFAPCFTLILQLRALDDFGSADELRSRIIELLRTTERTSLKEGHGRDEVADAQFALVAFIDETILSSDWMQKEHWLAKPLQLDLYDRYDAGEAFFERLEELRRELPEQAQVLEVYYLCMALGFKGRYLLHDQEKLRVLVEDTFEELRSAQGLRSEELSPHALPKDQTATEVRSKLPPWAIAAAAVAIALLVYIGMSFYISGAADEASEQIEAVVEGRPPG